MSENEKAIFETMPVTKAVIAMSLPNVLSSLVMILYNLADTFFVAALNDPIESAAVTLAGPVLLAFNVVNNLFGVGSSSLMSRSLGLQDFDRVRKTASFGFYGALIFGGLFSLTVTALETQLLFLLGADSTTAPATKEYLFWTMSLGAVPSIVNVVFAYLVRAEGASLQASIGTMSGCLINIILDPFFVLPQFLGMGAAGAGLATFLSNCAACLYFFIMLKMRKGTTFVSVHPSFFKPTAQMTREIWAVGFPAAIQNLLNVTGMMVLNNYAAIYGVEAVSAMGISHKIVMVPLNVALGFSFGIMPLLSYNYASGNTPRLKKILAFAFGLAISVMVIMTVILFTFGAEIMNVFMDNPTIVDYGGQFIKLSCIGLPFLCLDFIAVGVFQACGMGKYAFIFAVLRKIIFEIPAMEIWNRIYPLYGLALAIPTAEFILAIIAVIYLRRFFRKLEQRSIA